MRVWDTIIVKIEDRKIPISVEFDYSLMAFKVKGIEIEMFNPVLVRPPKDELEYFAIEYLLNFFKNKDIISYFGKEIEAKPIRRVLPPH